jgi:hypothetical protein
MLTSKRVMLIALALLLLASFSVAQKRRKNVVQVIPNPPSLNLSSDTTTVTLCPRDQSLAASRVRLTANASSPDGLPIRYTWKTTGGQIVGEGANPEWDLSGAAPGTYIASVDVTTGDARCTAFATIPVAVIECAPVREVCPNISISCPDRVTMGAPLTFAADVNGGTPGAQALYNWTVSTGTISSGQGTPTITVSTVGLGGQDVRATLTVNGYSGLNCTASCSTPVQAERIRPRQFDEFGDIARNDEKARLDVFASELQNDPRASGYILVWGGKPGAAPKRATDDKAYLVNTRGLDAMRIVTLTGRTGGDLRVQFWLVPAGAEAPTIPL